MVVPIRPASSSPAGILNNILSLGSQHYLKISSYPTSLRGPHCGHMFTSARSCPGPAAVRKSECAPGQPPTSLSHTSHSPASLPHLSHHSPTSLSHISHHSPTAVSSLSLAHSPASKPTPTSSPEQTPTNSPRLWHREFRSVMMNSKEICSHVSKTVYRMRSSCDHVRKAYGCTLSPFVVRTLASSTNIIPNYTECQPSKGESSLPGQCSFSDSAVLQSPRRLKDTTSKQVDNDIRFPEVVHESSSHSKHTNAPDAIPCEAGNFIHAYSSPETGKAETRKAKDSHIELHTTAHHNALPSTTSEDRESSCGYYDSQEEEEEGEENYYSEECDSESDDEIVFSDESEESKEEEDHKLVPCIPCRSKAPSRHLMTLFSEESGFVENSNSESYSDEEWAEEEEGEEGGVEGRFWEDSDETWKQFEEQAFSCSPALSPQCSLNMSVNAATVLLSQSPACSQLNTSTSPQSNSKNIRSCQSPSKHAQLMQRLLKSHVCTHRHRDCCSPNTRSNNCLVTENLSAPATPTSCRKRVSFVSEPQLVQVHHIVAWNYAYRSCRKGPWEQYARDRMHFRSRIDRVAGVIEPCLQRKLQVICHHS